ncbi:tetratricopeptide repeat protein [Knoellia locipacati]|uniref:AAA family ATPase n=1 Tax=Knoellia locipacati TaxID=882824 RepID=UPI00384E0782
MEPRRDDDAYFVGREHLLRRVVRDLEPDRAMRADEVTGATGMGKSTLLRRIRDSAHESAYSTVLLDLTFYEPGYAGRSHSRMTHTDALKNFDALKSVARTLVQHLRPDLVDRIEEAARLARVPVLELQTPSQISVSNVMNVGPHASVSDSGQSSASAGDDSAAAYDQLRVQRIISAGIDLSDALIECLNEISRTRPIMLLVDNVDRVIDTELGSWLLRVVQQLERTVVVLTHEPGRETQLPEGIGERVRIPPLTVEEVALYLERRQVADNGPELAALVHRSSGGVPIGVALVADLLADRSTGLSADHLRGRLDMSSSDPHDRIAGVVSGMVERLEGDVVGDALRAVSVTDDCDAELLADLLREMGHEDFRLREVMKDLETFSFTEEFRDENGYHVRVHPFIAKGLVESLARHDEADLLTRLHRIAATYYFARLKSRSDYGEMFTYEQPATQSLLRKWLRQLVNTKDESSYLEVASIYFDAFWWWGNYVHFDFCDVLVEDLADLATTVPDNARMAEFADALRRFGHHYPYRAKHRRQFDDRHQSADWEQVRGALYDILDHCGLLARRTSRRAGAAAAAPAVAAAAKGLDTTRQVTGLIDVFMAHSHRYEGTIDLALEHYESAAATLEGMRGNWDFAWVVFEHADTLFEAGRVAEALRGAERAAAIHAQIEDDVDDELVANLHRLRGDCLWSTGDHEAALRECASAVLHAYLFHHAGESPDDYTMQFYFEIRGRALERLLALRDSGDRAALVRGIEAVVGSMPTSRWPRPDPEGLADEMASLSVPDLADRLFARGPKVEELGQTTSAFMSEIRPRVPQLLRMLADDLPLGPTSSDDSPSPP